MSLVYELIESDKSLSKYSNFEYTTLHLHYEYKGIRYLNLISEKPINLNINTFIILKDLEEIFEISTLFEKARILTCLVKLDEKRR